MADPSGIAEQLFDSVNDYCGLIDSGDRSIDESLGKNNDLIVFAENLLVQFSRRHLPKPITGLSDRSDRQLSAQRRKMERSGDRLQAQRLMYKFEELCSYVGEVSYSSSEEESEQFHLEYFPAFLEVVTEWLDEVGGDERVKTAAADALTNFNQAVGLA